jgi:hypothetical protein
VSCAVGGLRCGAVSLVELGELLLMFPRNVMHSSSRIQQLKKSGWKDSLLGPLDAKDDGTVTLQTPGTTHPKTWCHVLEELSPQLHCSEDRRSCTVLKHSVSWDNFGEGFCRGVCLSQVSYSTDW